jgi:ankyrin repeat protein
VECLIDNGADINLLDKKRLNPYSFAIKHNKISIAELLADRGASANGVKGKDSKKTKQKKTIEEEGEKTEEKPKCYYLVRVLDNGEKVRMTKEEVEAVLSDYPEADTLLNSSDALGEEEANAPEEYIYI